MIRAGRTPALETALVEDGPPVSETDQIVLVLLLFAERVHHLVATLLKYAIRLVSV